MTLDSQQYTQNFIEDGYCLNEIPDFQGLLPKSHQVGVPVFELTDSEMGETGPIFEQMVSNRSKFQDKFQTINDKLIKLLSHV